MMYRRTDYRRTDLNILMLRMGMVWHYCTPDGVPNGTHAEHDSYFDSLLNDGVLVPLERVYLAINIRTAQLQIVADGTEVDGDWKLITAPGGLYVL